MSKTPNNLASSQATVATTATLVAAARLNRRAVTIVLHGAAPAETFVGPAGVETTTGAAIPAVQGASITLETAAAVYAIVAAGTQVVGVIESFD